MTKVALSFALLAAGMMAGVSAAQTAAPEALEPEGAEITATSLANQLGALESGAKVDSTEMDSLQAGAAEHLRGELPLVAADVDALAVLLRAGAGVEETRALFDSIRKRRQEMIMLMVTTHTSPFSPDELAEDDALWQELAKLYQGE